MYAGCGSQTSTSSASSAVISKSPISGISQT